MTEDTVISSLDSGAAVQAVNAALMRIDARLVDHGERVAFIALELQQAGSLPLDARKLFLCSLFHDIGAYKTDEIDRMVQFETNDALNHSLYGYLFLKHMTPLGEDAEPILYHHFPWTELRGLSTPNRYYATLLHLADRLDILSFYPDDQGLAQWVKAHSQGWFYEPYLEVFRSCYQPRRIFERLRDGSYRQDIQRYTQTLCVTGEDALEFIRMIVYSIDFRSEHTVTHTINTTSISLHLARRFHVTSMSMDRIYLGALLHDVGKISIPLGILEYPGRLSEQEMTVMRTHVDETEKIISGLVPDDVCLLATRHHEKLDGSGYPRHLTGDMLTLPQRIVAVADIVSALTSRRSYKEPFPKEKTLAILQSMKGDKLDQALCDYVCEHYDEIMRDTDIERDTVIQSYQNIVSEYQQLQQRFAGAC